MFKNNISIMKFPEYVRFLWWQAVATAKLKKNGVSLGAEIRFYGIPIVSTTANGEMSIGARCHLVSNTEFTALGVNHPVILRLLRPGASIQIGTDTGISGASICAALSIEIGANVLLGANVIITDTDFHSIKPAGRRYNMDTDEIKAVPVFIGNNVFIGANVLLLKGSRIGENSVVGAGSVVTGKIPSNVIAAGNPARVIRAIS